MPVRRVPERQRGEPTDQRQRGHAQHHLGPPASGQPLDQPAAGRGEAQPAGDGHRDGERAPAPDPCPLRELLRRRDLFRREHVTGGGRVGHPARHRVPGDEDDRQHQQGHATHEGDRDPDARVRPARPVAHPARSSSRACHRDVSSRSPKPNSDAQRGVHLGAGIHGAIEVHQTSLTADVGQEPAGQPGRLVRRPQVCGRGVELGLPGQLRRRAVGTDLPDDLPSGHGDGQVDVAQGDVVGEALQQPQRHGADRRVRGHVHRLVAHHHLRSAGFEVAEHVRVDEDVDRPVGRERAVGGRGHRRDRVVLPRVAVQGAVKGGERRRHLHHQPRPPARQHAVDGRHRRLRQRLEPVGLAGVPGDEDERAGVAAYDERGGHPQRRAPVTTADGGDHGAIAVDPEPEPHLGQRRGGVEATERPGGVDRRLPGAVLGDAAQLVDVPQGEFGDLGRCGVFGQGDQLVAGGVVVGVCQVPRPLGTALQDGILEAAERLAGERGRRGPGGTARRRGDVRVVVEHEPGEQAGDQQQGQRKAGHPPEGATGLSDVLVSQGERRLSTAWSTGRTPRHRCWGSRRARSRRFRCTCRRG